MKDFIRIVMNNFPGSFINGNFELILIPKTNTYFRLENCESELDVKCKLIEYVSYHCCNAIPYRRKCLVEKYHRFNLIRLNRVLQTRFSEDDMEVIYSRLGNGIHHDLTVRFVESYYDMGVLKDE